MQEQYLSSPPLMVGGLRTAERNSPNLIRLRSIVQRTFQGALSLFVVWPSPTATLSRELPGPSRNGVLKKYFSDPFKFSNFQPTSQATDSRTIVARYHRAIHGPVWGTVSELPGLLPQPNTFRPDLPIGQTCNSGTQTHPGLSLRRIVA